METNKMEMYEQSGSYAATWLFPELTYILGYVEDGSEFVPKIPDTATNTFGIDRKPALEPEKTDVTKSKGPIEYQTTSQKPILENLIIASIVIAAFITPVLLWFSIPYPEPRIEDFFSDKHTAAIRMTIDFESDSRLFSVVEDLMTGATKGGHEAISSEGLFGKLYDYTENVAPFYANCIISSDQKEDEVVFHAIYPESENKLSQFSWDLAAVKMDSSQLTDVGSAKLANIQAEGATEESIVGATWFRGNYLVGHIGTSMQSIIEAISSEEINENSGNTYLLQNWPYGSESPLVAIVENKDNCLARYAAALLKQLKYTFNKKPTIKERINANKEIYTKELESSMREQDIDDYINSISSSAYSSNFDRVFQ